MFQRLPLVRLALAALLVAPAFGAVAEDYSCSPAYQLPADIDLTLPTANPTEAQWAFDELSWNSFLALNAPEVGARPGGDGDKPPQWSQWSSTVDLIACQNNPANCICPSGQCLSGDHYYPAACRSIPDFQNYRVLGQLSKIDDSFLEAARGQLSNHPVLDANGNFVRYEILVNPVAYDFVVSNGYYNRAGLSGLAEPVTFPCGDADYQGGDPANPRMGAIVLKAAWMELEDPGQGAVLTTNQAGLYHTERLLVYSPASRSITGVESCELKTMALIGMHVAHKTVRQPGWIWSTFEHSRNAPECTSLPPQGDQAGSGPNTNCPGAVAGDYNLYAKACSDGSPHCQTCNAVPVSNSPDPTRICTSEEVSAGTQQNTGWCLDLPPAPERGQSKLCRQVPSQVGYPTAFALNQSCKAQIGPQSVWSNYELISTQWINQASSVCQNGVTAPGRTRNGIHPQVVLLQQGMPAQWRPYLGNSSMESYGRSNCIGCHLQAGVQQPGQPKVNTDQMYWLQLEAFDTE